MAIPKKGSRKITVEEIDYRWLIRKKATYSQADYGVGSLHLAIEHAENPGIVLIIYTDRGHPSDYGTKEIVPVTPADVSKWILQAMELGWKPAGKGPQFSVYVREDEMHMAN